MDADEQAYGPGNDFAKKQSVGLLNDILVGTAKSPSCYCPYGHLTLDGYSSSVLSLP